MKPSQRPEPTFLCPLVRGNAERLRTLLSLVLDHPLKATGEDRRQVREAVEILLTDRAKWDQYVTHDTQERMRYLFQNLEDLPLEALQWIVTTNREGTPE